MTIQDPAPRVKRADLRKLDDLDGSVELMYFGLKGMTREADDLLARHGLSRAHHRILFVIARMDGITVGDLRHSLGISAQAMHRPLRQLSDNGMIATSRDPARHRYKALHLTARGRAVEHDATEAERRVLRDAFERAGPQASVEWAKVMATIAESA